MVDVVYLRPISDISVGNWTTDTGATTGLFATIDEETANDADFMRSGPLSLGVPDAVVIGLSGATDPLSAIDHRVEYRIRKQGPAVVNITVDLMNGETQIASWTHSDVVTTYVDGVQPLTEAQANAITNYSDVRLRVVATRGYWFDIPEYEDFAAIADFNNDRYALPEQGTELVTNGTFDSALTGWTHTGADITATWVGGVAQMVRGAGGIAGRMSQDFTTVSGRMYVLTATCPAGSPASGWINISSTGGRSVAIGATASYVFVAGGGTETVEAWPLNTGSTFQIDNISVKEVNLTAVGGVYPKRSATFAEWFAYTASSTVARTYTNSGGSIVNDLAVDAPRFSYVNSKRQLRLENAATNLFLNSATGVTQGVSVTATAHALSFYGTGTITLTGTSTAGPLVGTGASNRVSLIFTPTAGTLTLTVSGTVTSVQLETTAYASASDYIPTAGASVTRAIETARFSPLIEAILQRAAASIIVRAQNVRGDVGGGRLAGGDGFHTFIHAAGGTPPSHAVLSSFNGSASLELVGLAAGFNLTAFGAGMSFDGTGRSVAGEGLPVVSDAGAAPSRPVAYLARDNNVVYGNGFYDFVAIAPERLSDTALQALAVPA